MASSATTLKINKSNRGEQVSEVSMAQFITAQNLLSPKSLIQGLSLRNGLIRDKGGLPRYVFLYQISHTRIRYE